MANKQTAVTIGLNDGSTHEATIENYSAQSVADMLNEDNAKAMVAFGDIVVHRANVTRIGPVAQNEQKSVQTESKSTKE